MSMPAIDESSQLRAPRALLAALTFVAIPSLISADTLYVQGKMSARVSLEVVERYQPAPGTEWIALKARKTPTFGSTTWRQSVVSEQISYSTRPSSVKPEKDDNGNDFQTEIWERPTATIEIVRRTVVDMEAVLSPVESRAPFPLPSVPADAARFLQATDLTQRDDPRIQDLAKRLTAGVRTEREAVSSIMNFVVDHVQYHFDPKSYAAIYALESKTGNCQNFAHLSIALLRAVGIPARVASGISLSKGWQVTTSQGQLTMKMGQGRHAWLEVFFSDIGWIPYDPQTSHLFVSLYHVRQAVGLDAKEIAFMTSARPNLPDINHTINGESVNDNFGIRTVSQARTPKSYVISSVLRDAAPPPPLPPPPPPAPTPAPLPSLSRVDFTKPVEFGNLEFPASLRIFGPAERVATGGFVQARSTFIVETADYATGPDELAQAFTTTQPMLLSDISLALQKFGGQSGEIWLELFQDQGRKPGPRIGESRRLPVGGLIDRGGYRWFVFDIAPREQGIVLPAGRYWAVLRSNGDGIFNWFFSIGNAYGEPDDTRARRRGAADWPTILNYRFNFRVSGLVKP